MADDDPDDRDLAREALQDVDFVEDVRFVAEGQELLDDLRASGSGREHPRPSLVLLDLNMPRKDGREALAEIRADAELRRIPVVVLTTSDDEEDVRGLYELGANSYITKPVTGARLHASLARLVEYWSQVVTLPGSA